MTHDYQLQWLTGPSVGVTHRTTSWRVTRRSEWLTGLLVAVTNRTTSRSNSPNQSCSDSQDWQIDGVTHRTISCSDLQDYQLQWRTTAHRPTSWSDSQVYLLEWLTGLLVGVTHRSTSWSDLQVYQLEWLWTEGLPAGRTRRDYQVEEQHALTDFQYYVIHL